MILTESILRGRLTARKQELFFTETENSTVQMYVEHMKAKNDKVNMRYLAYLLNRIAYKFVSRVGNNKLMNDAMKKIVVPVPKRQLQDEFADFVQSVEKSKF